MSNLPIVTPKPRQPAGHVAKSKQRRTFQLSIGSHSYGRRFTFEDVGNSIMDCCTYTMEKLVLLLGPMLIIFASIIISGLTYTFFTIVLPMLKEYYLSEPTTSSMSYVWITLHVIYVVFVLSEIVFNYFMCVTTRNKGKNYDLVVRELALATNFIYPESPMEVENFRKDYEDRMLLRIKRRQMRSTNTVTTTTTTNNGKTTTTITTKDLENHNNETNEQQQSSTITNNTDALAQRKTTTVAAAATSAKSSSGGGAGGKKLPTPKQVRNWMLMASDEWGYCQRSKQPKPPRSHYDHVTKSLVLNLDHYCPWMFNTVGYFNYRYFCSFLWFVVMAMSYGAAITFVPFQNCSGPLYQKQNQLYMKTGDASTRLKDHPFVPFRHERMPISMSFMLCLAVGIAVAMLGLFHLYLCLTAQTTIEFHGNWMNKNKAKKLNKKWKNPYDLGYKKNWEHIFGSSQKWYWSLLIPSTRQPEYLPLPLPGEEGKRRKYKQEISKKSKKKNTMDNNNDHDGAEIV